jgi:hypothetical protein
VVVDLLRCFGNVEVLYIVDGVDGERSFEMDRCLRLAKIGCGERYVFRDWEGGEECLGEWYGEKIAGWIERGRGGEKAFLKDLLERVVFSIESARSKEGGAKWSVPRVRVGMFLKEG